MGKSSRVEETNDSSTVSKLSMLRANYMDHGGACVLEWFVKWERRTSLINRGYYVRVAAIQGLCHGFIKAHEKEAVQMVNLGAGFDALFLRLLTKDPATECMTFDGYENCHFVEVDLEKVMRHKAAVVRSKVAPCTVAAEKPNRNQNHERNIDRIFPNYTLVVGDLRLTEALKCKLLNDCDLNPDLPTLFIAECVLNYLTAEDADKLLVMLSNTFKQSSFVVYEQVEPGDKFGRTMVKHFDKIGSPLMSIDTYPTINSQFERYYKLGFDAVNCFPIGHLYYDYVKYDDRIRLTSLEMFDEYEMWHAKCAHYVIAVASKSESQQKRLLREFKISNYDVEKPLICSPLKTIQHSFALSASRYVRRFSHKAALLQRTFDSGNRSLYLFYCGGWGIDERNQQSRKHVPCLLRLDLNRDSTKEVSCNANSMAVTVTPVVVSDVHCAEASGFDGVDSNNPSESQLSCNANSMAVTVTPVEVSDVHCAEASGFDGVDSNNPSESQLFERCYHSLTSVLDSRTLFLFGGRRSPREALSSPVLIRLNEEMNEIKTLAITSQDGQTTPSGRWRHAATAINTGAAERKDAVVICGGVANADGKPLRDCWIFYLTDFTWKRLPDPPIAVHSHAMCYDTVRGTLIVSGGLEIDDRISSRLQIFSFDRNSWTTLEAPIGFLTYGSSCFLGPDSTLISVGGVSTSLGECHYLAVLRLKFSDCESVGIEFSKVYGLPETSDFLLMNHDAVYDEITRRVFVLGGGGNCFSFGTCFNEALLEIVLS